MYIDAQMIITGVSLLTALASIIGIVLAVHKWYLKQEQQDVDIKSLKEHDIKALKEEMCLLTYGLLACLDGLEQLGCNHTVPATKDKIQKHINQQAHK